MNLNQSVQSTLDVWGNHRLLIGTSRNHHVSGFDGRDVCMDLEAWGARLLPERNDWRATPCRRSDVLGVSLDEADNLIAWRKVIRVRPAIGITGEFHRPVRELKCERVPSSTPPPLRNSLPFEDDVLATELREEVAHRQTGLATTDDNGIDVFRSHTPPLTALRLVVCGLVNLTLA